MHSWNDPHNAELYDQYTRKHRLYRDTSRDLVDLAAIENARIVVDLACGTGVTTEAILERLDSTARVVAIDGSEAMSQLARRRVPDPRVTWVIADGSGILDHVSNADAILCNSAMWQMEMDQTIIACATALRPGGRLVFNIGRGYLSNSPDTGERPSKSPSFLQFVHAVALCDHGYLPLPEAERATRSRKRLNREVVQTMLRNAGLVLDLSEDRVYDTPPESQLDWFNVPVFADTVLAGMPYEQQREVIAKAYERFLRFEKNPGRKKRMVTLVARKPWQPNQAER